MLIGVLIYFIVASRLKLGFETTIAFGFPTFLIFGLAITGFSVIFAFSTMIVGLMLAWVYQRIVGNK